ncbi:MAG: cytochrome b N-terminal domain-containing protein [Nitrospinae bacterium]|nr:cytochrome b N-terminal domain-containing protein [Nitrospinota bacterium]
MSLLDKLKQLDYPVPEHSMRAGYMLGGLAGFIFIPLVVSGLVMAYYGYVPSAAHRTAAEMAETASLSGIRAAHSLAADAFLILIFLHMTRVVLTRSYSGARSKNWRSGVVILVLSALFFYTGTALRVDQAGYEAYSHFEQFVPVNKVWFRGFHVIALPLLLMGIIGVHAILVKINKISPLAPGHEEGVGPQSTFFKHMRYVMAYGLIIIGVIHVATAYYTPPLIAAPIVEGVEWTKPSWPFLFLYPLDTWALVAVPVSAVIAMLIIPLFVNSSKKWDFSQGIFFLLVALWAGLALYGAFIHYA